MIDEPGFVLEIIIVLSMINCRFLPGKIIALKKQESNDYTEPMTAHGDAHWTHCGKNA